VRGGIGPLEDSIMKTDTTLSRRRLLADVPAVAAVGVPSVATALGGLATGDDPVFAAIEAHRATIRAFTAAFPPGYWNTPEYIAAEPEIENANELDEDAEAAFLTTQPTTLAGILASLEHAAEDTGGDGTILDSASRCNREDVSDAAEAYLAMIAAAMRKLLTA
jgi:hypothetical protein